MAVFLSTYENKIDKKGRVSVPASFRAILSRQEFQGVVIFPSHKYPALEACGMDRMETLSASVDALDVFSDEQDQLGTAIFADAHPVTFDADGRVNLPQNLAEHAGITDKALFVGAGPIFRIWEPTAYAEHKKAAQEALKNAKRTLVITPQNSGEKT